MMLTLLAAHLWLSWSRMWSAAPKVWHFMLMLPLNKLSCCSSVIHHTASDSAMPLAVAPLFTLPQYQIMLAACSRSNEVHF